MSDQAEALTLTHQRLLDQARAYQRVHGHLDVPQRESFEGYPLGVRLRDVRHQVKHDPGAVPHLLVEALVGLGFDPAPVRPGRKGPPNAGLVAARAFHAREGHLDVPRGYHENGVALFEFLGRARYKQERGELGRKTFEVLDTLGFEWDRDKVPVWQVSALNARLAEVEAFYREHGSINPPVPLDARTRAWLNGQRRRYQRGEQVPAVVREALTRWGFDWDAVNRPERIYSAEESLVLIEQWVVERGVLDIRYSDTYHGAPVGTALSGFRKQYHRGTLDSGTIERLERLGIDWGTARGPRSSSRGEGLRRAQEWVAEHGPGSLAGVADSTRVGENGYQLGAFIRNHRRRADGPIARALDDIDPGWRTKPDTPGASSL